ncbi:hypothetical protein ACQ4M3_07335 [Leptolyngbya sp. AN03gr2]|uniref:hypothetical protein n=1 Tax=unclassified Leptolyngbya TaxID=2650499 RepID=UPI003D31F0BA
MRNEFLPAVASVGCTLETEPEFVLYPGVSRSGMTILLPGWDSGTTKTLFVFVLLELDFGVANSFCGLFLTSDGFVCEEGLKVPDCTLFPERASALHEVDKAIRSVMSGKVMPRLG